MVRQSIRAVAAFASIAILAACTSGNNVTPAPMPTSTPSITLTRQQQAYEATSAMFAANGVRFASIFAALFRLSIYGNRAAALSTPAPVCKDGVEQITQLTPDGPIFTIDVFYDPQCKVVFVKSKLSALINLANSTVNLTGNATAYDRAGQAVGYGKITGLAKVQGSFSTTTITGDLSQTPSGPGVLSFGLTCTLQQKTDSGSCGFGGLSNVPNASSTSFAVSTQFDNFVGTGRGSGTVALNAYTGKAGSLSLKQGSGIAWNVIGGSHVVAQTGTFDETVNDKTFDVVVGLLLKDHRIDANVSNHLNGQGMAGTVFQTSIGRAAASYETDPLGIGAIDYSMGSKGKILLFIVVS